MTTICFLTIIVWASEAIVFALHYVIFYSMNSSGCWQLWLSTQAKTLELSKLTHYGHLSCFAAWTELAISPNPIELRKLTKQLLKLNTYVGSGATFTAHALISVDGTLYVEYPDMRGIPWLRFTPPQLNSSLRSQLSWVSTLLGHVRCNALHTCIHSREL